MRNVLCPRYGACLDEAIKTNAKGFSCGGCPDEETEGPLDDDDPMGYILLWIAILEPDLYAEMLQLRRLEGIRRDAGENEEY
jgi:hypothetical protein